MTIANLQILTNLLIDGNTNNLSNANFLVLLNQAYERITGKILAETVGGKWPYGDANYTAFPTYTLNMTNSTAEYQIDSLTTPLVILGIEVLDNTGIWHPLNPISLEQIRASGIAQVEYYKTDGRPVEYEKREHMIVLYPAPDNGVSVTLSGGLKIFFLRTADTYSETERSTGTKEPGFPSPWHDILAYEAAYYFAMARGLGNLAWLKNEMDRKERELLKFISRRNQDERPIMTNKGVNY